MATFPNFGVQNSTNVGVDPTVIPVTVNSGVSCTSSAGGTSIITIPASGAPVLLVNAATATVFLGRQGVTTTTGYALAPSAAVLVTYGEGSNTYGGQSCALYGIVSSTSSTVTPYSVTTWGPQPGQD